MPAEKRPPFDLRHRAAMLVALSVQTGIPAGAKSIEEAFHDMAVVQGDDPNGFSLMIISVVLLMSMAITLMVITGMYLYKPSPKATKVDSDDTAV